MTTKCNFCDYHKETPLSEDILRVMAAPDLPHEDWILWSQRLVIQAGTSDWASVKIHMGMKHKEQTHKGIWPHTIFSEAEKSILTHMV